MLRATRRQDELLGLRPALALTIGLAAVCGAVVTPLTLLAMWALQQVGGFEGGSAALLAAAAVWVAFWLGLSVGLGAGLTLSVRAWHAGCSVAQRQREGREARLAVAEAEALLGGRR
jgi:hypothetical protein